ncbi:MAG TPA: ABC transporter ATP-binding protein, partial [Rhodanobacteraceae bacterium]|nr:ABC transporter ATP-binding protein [Rhodanobacteraceae bacterium]
HWHGVDRASLIAVCLLLGRLLPYLVSTRQSFQQLRSAAPALELWQRHMRMAPDRPPAVASPPPPGAALHIERVQLAPPLAGLEVGDLLLRPGELTLVCGDSGIGKSSVVDVLAGMVAPAAFAARMGERRLDFEQYRAVVRKGAYVSQEVRPWQHSIGECLRWAAPDATDAELRAALADVGLGRQLAAWRHGLDTPLRGTSSRLSGGELQRLLLAQVILRQPCLALLDEATNALDAASEQAVLMAMKRRLPQTILIVVSHRPAVAAIADQCLSIGDDLRATLVAAPMPYLSAITQG